MAASCPARKPLARNALYQILQRTLQVDDLTELAARPQDKTPQRKARILLVEDNPVNQLVAKGMLGKLGCEVTVAAHGGEALSQLDAMPEERERCRAAGMSDYLAKPFRREELMALLELWVAPAT